MREAIQVHLIEREKKFEKIIQDIKDIKIQGANNIAINGINAFLLKSDFENIKKIYSARPTEPLLQNALKILEKSSRKTQTARKLISYIENSKKQIAHLGADLIKDDMNIFSHCHSSTVMDILKYARKIQKKNFVVYTLEVEPLLQGRKTAEELAEAGIKVIVFPDLAAEQAIKKCDLFLFGSDAYLKNAVVNKIGTSMLCHLAHELKIPAYSCGVSLKYVEKVKIESRSGREVWDEKNSKITVVNPAFDITENKIVTGIISELGILKANTFVKYAKHTIKSF
jgi:translation initiation factor eIF-2B subunit delta